LEFISISVLLTSHQIGIDQEVTLISSTSHASKVFTTPIITFEDTHDHHKIVVPTGFQNLSQMELAEITGVELVKKIISQLIAKGQFNLGL